jgi:glycine/D-amino acid oxidase-like deaminating enzyme
MVVEVVEMIDRKDVDVAVVGGGLAGLTAAAFAARLGSSVVVLDAHALGGRACTTSIDGFRFNQGPHALYETGEAMAALRELGVPVPGGAPSRTIGVIVDGVQERFPVGAGSMLCTGALSASGKAAATRLLAALPKHNASKARGMTVDEWIAGRKLPKDAAALVHVLVRVSTYANAPDLLDAGAVVQQLQRALKGVRYLDGGWQVMVDGVAAIAARAGAEITDHVRVDSIDPASDAWVLTTSAGEVRAKSVVLAAGGPNVAARLLGVDASVLGDPGPKARATCLELGLDTSPATPVLFSTDAPLYFSTHMPPAQLGPAGATVVHVAKYLAPDDAPSPEVGAQELWGHARAAGVDRGSAAVLASRCLHDMTVTYGIPQARLGGFDGRPRVAVAEMPGIFLAGDWVGHEGMLLDAAMASARHAAAQSVRQAALVTP